MPYWGEFGLENAHLSLTHAAAPAHWQRFASAKVGGNEVVDAETNVLGAEPPAHVGGVQQPVGGDLDGSEKRMEVAK